MSRTKAKKLFTVDDQIELRPKASSAARTSDVIDEIPMAYKDIDAVMEAQQDPWRSSTPLKQVVCVKGWLGKGRLARTPLQDEWEGVMNNEALISAHPIDPAMREQIR